MSTTYNALRATANSEAGDGTATATATATATSAAAAVRRRSSVTVVQQQAPSSSHDHQLLFDTVDLHDTGGDPLGPGGTGRKPTYKKLPLYKSHPSDVDTAAADDGAGLDGDDSDDGQEGIDGGHHHHHHQQRRGTPFVLPKVFPRVIADQLQDYVNVLEKFPQFKYYLLSHICQHIGDWFVRIASLLVVQELSTKGSALSELVLATKLPMALFAQVGGILADRYDRRILMITLDLVAGVTVLGYLFAVHYQSLEVLYTVTVLRSAIGACYYPVTTGIVPLLVPDRRDLQYAVTMNGWAWSIVAVLGGVVAGGATAVIGLQACYVLDSVTFFASAAVVHYGITGNYNVSRRPTTASTEAATGDAVGGGSPSPAGGRSCSAFRQLVWYLSTCGFGLLVLMKPSASFVWGPEDVVGALFATVRDESTGDEEEATSSVRTGLLFSFIGVGCLIGPTLLNFITDANRPSTLQRACVIGLGFSTTGWLAISLAPSYVWFLPCTVIRTMGSAIVFVFSTIMLQSMVEKELLGRVLSVEYTFYTLTEAASATATGRLDDAGYSTHGLALFAAALGALTVAFWGAYHLLSRGAADPKFNQPRPLHGEPTVSSLSLELPSVAELEEGPPKAAQGVQ